MHCNMIQPRFLKRYNFYMIFIHWKHGVEDLRLCVNKRLFNLQIGKSKPYRIFYQIPGETGLGKSTLINSLFLTDVYDKDKHPGPSLRVKKTVGVETSVVLLKENGVNLTLTIVDTPGFGDAVDNSNWFVLYYLIIFLNYFDGSKP